MNNRKRLVAVCLAIMGLGLVGEGVAMAQRPPRPTHPPYPPAHDRAPGGVPEQVPDRIPPRDR